MNVSDAVRSRKSVRAFLNKPVPQALLREVLSLAARSPSGGNVQPWRIDVLVGEPLVAFKDRIEERMNTDFSPDPAEYPIYPTKLGEPYRSSRFKVGESMYELIDIARDDKMGRLRWLQNNYRFFGAPVGLFCTVDRDMGAAQWSDLGMYLQTLMLLLRERGVDSCPQEAWSVYHQTVREFLQTPPERMLFCGMAIGYADPAAAVNRLQSEREPLEQFARLWGFDA
ncbi:Nitroreductase [Collimonas sp. OK307]|uniref:nitroreductase n=1 Tax=Collimonas sp. OK307 TaxID=1801620 RepID=UPI0008E5B6A9|nr:nitroreductase [Collimonas sp. OK307]SFI00521.1 Nitroreductase [Collimonas sp. OK307]